MAEVVLRIKANEGADVLIGFSADEIVNNVSSAIGTATTDNNGVNGKSFATGFLSLKDGFIGGQDSKLQSEVDKYNGFMFGATDSAGNYTVTLSLQGENLDKVVLVGDKAANQFPTTAILDEGTEHEKTIHSDDANWAIGFDLPSGSHTIKFTKWNRPNYNACFTTLKVMIEYLELDKGWIDYVESVSQSTSDASSIQYGVLANSGSTNIRDLNGELEDFVKDDVLLSSNIPVDLIINGEKVRSHITQDSDYLKQSKQLQLQLTNDVRKFRNLFGGMFLKETMTAFEILEMLLLQIGYNSSDIISMISSQVVVLDETVSLEDYLKEITIPFPFLEESTYEEAINKICSLAQLTMIIDKNGNPKFLSSRPIATKQEIKNAILIDDYAIFGDGIQSSLFTKNKINIVGYTDKNEHLIEKKANQFDICIYAIDPNKNTTYLWDSLQHAQEYNAGYTINNYNEVSSTEYKRIAGNITFKQARKDLNILNASYYSQLGSSSYYRIKTGTEIVNQVWDNAFSVNVIGGFLFENKIDTEGNIQIPFNILIEMNESGTKVLSLSETAWCQSLAFNDKIINANSDYEIPTSEILKDSDTYKTKKLISEVLVPTIKKDYKNGVHTATLNVFLLNKYSKKDKAAANSKLIEVGDIITLSDGESQYWRVTGSKFIYDGSPRQQLELQEIVGID